MENNAQLLLPFIFSLVRYFVLAGIPFLFFYLILSKQFSKNKIQSRTAGRKDFMHEILYSTQTALIFGMVPLILLYSPLKNYTKLYTSINDYPLWWIPVSIGVALVMHDTYFYWMHRIMHHPKIYSKIHSVHHQSINPSPWASYSFHLIEAFFEAMIAPILIFTLPMHPVSLLFFALLAFAINVYGHLGYEIMPKWFRQTFMFEIIGTSIYHNLHHEKFEGNYGLYFRIWDRLMKTENPKYVQEFDKIQQRRFSSQEFSDQSSQNLIKIRSQKVKNDIE